MTAIHRIMETLRTPSEVAVGCGPGSATFSLGYPQQITSFLAKVSFHFSKMRELSYPL